MRALWIVMLLALPELAWPCTIPPKDLFDTDEELVRSANVIVLARAVGIAGDRRGGRAVFRFESVRVLKGSDPKRFDLEGYHSDKVKGPGDFSDHHLPEFWAGAGNSIQPGDCQAWGLFKVGESYLIFLRKSSHFRSYENVRSDKDLWLKVIELLVDSEKKWTRP